MMIPSWAKVGARVVCIRTAPSGFTYEGETWPVYGQVYTIREVGDYSYLGFGDDKIVLRLVEIVNPKVFTCEGLIERGLLIKDFRPIVTLESDMEAHFHRLLKAPAAPESVR